MKILANGYKNILLGKNTDAGSEVFFRNLIPHIKKEKHELINLMIQGLRSPEEKDFYRKFKKRGLNFVNFRTYFGFKKIREAKTAKLPESTKIAVAKVKEIIAKENPDAVLINGFNLYNWVILKAASELNIPIFDILHGLWFQEFAVYSETLKQTPAGHKITKNMEADIARYAAKMFFVSQYSMDQYQNNISRIPKGKGILLPLPYNKIFEKAVPRKNREPKLNIGIVARWDPIKNHPAYLEVAKLAKKMNLPWEFHAVTTISKTIELLPYKKEYKKYVKVYPNTTPLKLRDFYQKMDLLLLPSKFDVFPTVVMEGLLQKRLTLISKNVGWKSVYKKFGLDKLVVNFDKPQEIIEAIKKNSQNPPPSSLIRQIKENNSSEAVFKFLIRTMESNS